MRIDAKRFALSFQEALAFRFGVNGFFSDPSVTSILEKFKDMPCRSSKLLEPLEAIPWDLDRKRLSQFAVFDDTGNSTLPPELSFCFLAPLVVMGILDEIVDVVHLLIVTGEAGVQPGCL